MEDALTELSHGSAVILPDEDDVWIRKSEDTPNKSASDSGSPLAQSSSGSPASKSAKVEPAPVAAAAAVHVAVVASREAPTMEAPKSNVTVMEAARGQADQDDMWADFLHKHPNFLKDVPKPSADGKFKRRPSSENVTYQQYTDKHKSEYDRVLELEKPDGWTFKQEERGVKVYTKAVDNCKLLYFKGTNIVKCESMCVLMQKMFKPEDRPKWDEMCISGRSAEGTPPFYRVTYVALKAPAAWISQRDLVGIGRWKFVSPDVVVVALRSEEHPDLPEQNGFVRINFIEGGYVLRDQGNGTFLVTYTACVDPKGWLPTWAANMGCVKQALTLAKLKEYIDNSTP